MSGNPVIPSLESEHEEMLTVRETASRLTISIASTYQLIRAGHLPHYRIGGAIRVATPDISIFLSKCRHAPPEQNLVVPDPQPRPTLRHINLSR